VLGGYVSARIAARDEMQNGALGSILCLGFWGMPSWAAPAAC